MIIYLYKKTHNVTGLQYLGKTTSTNPHKYKGSGKRWANHIAKHGYDVTTEILKECETIDEIKHWGRYYSKLWNVVESNEWANLTEENGEGGFVPHTNETKEKIRCYQRDKKIWTADALENRLKNCLFAAASRKGKKNPDHSKFMSNMIRTDESNKKRSDTLKGRQLSKGREGHVYPDENKITCEHCRKKLIPGYYNRYHGNNCKLNKT